jgi:hypothetical protein
MIFNGVVDATKDDDDIDLQKMNNFIQKFMETTSQPVLTEPSGFEPTNLKQGTGSTQSSKLPRPEGNVK